MTGVERLKIVILLLVIVLTAGVFGYQVVEGWSPFDSLYMTIITLATVGYGETHPLSTSGRVFTVALIFMGVGTLTYGLTAITAFVVEGTVSDILRRKRMDAKIKTLENHVILCGLGETGRHVAVEFINSKTLFVVIEKNMDRIRQMGKIGSFLYIEGDATDDEVLKKANIEQAKGLVSALPQDRDNVFVILTARELNPRLRIVSKVDEVESQVKLKKAGADSIISANHIAGLKMASEVKV